ncbi:hypothetical protein BDB00DRAFT_929727 [Zychaea mexicana]|uniref:uncharacterized protein n=1 Tax=Zychaea mexicana TaxID=64656 RepID=UPI0022FDCF64|nr:uncharacterized protein BDB00DRAFT_929727 [Zychaea mexicana]KAI9492337.1 hypothetical protein BDB00DRAFT_929727 [Zychaea mexicana]
MANNMHNIIRTRRTSTPRHWHATIPTSTQHLVSPSSTKSAFHLPLSPDKYHCDQSYITKHTTDARMRSAVGLYEDSGWPSYVDNNGDGFLLAWRMVHDAPRSPATEKDGSYVANQGDPAGSYGAGIEWHGRSLLVTDVVGSHTVTDVFIYANVYVNVLDMSFSTRQLITDRYILA